MAKKKVADIGAAKVRRMLLASLQAAEYNPRVITGDALDALRASLNRYGLVAPIVVNIRGGKNVIVGGHQRVRILTEDGVDKCACVVVDLSKKDEKLLNLALNNPDAQGEFIDGIDAYIEKLRGNIKDDDLMLKLRLMELEEAAEGLTDDDAIPPKPKPICKEGELWLLGKHRLLCGDATKAEVVAQLMGGNKAEMVFTDPPYGVNYSDSAKARVHGDQTQVAIPLSFKCMVEIATKADARFYWCGANKNAPMYFTLFDAYCNSTCSQIIWVKDRFNLMHHNYHSQFEVVFFGWKGKGGGKKTWFGDRKQSDVWKFDRDATKDYKHPTQKPVGIVAKALRNSCPMNGVACDPFLGSGTTMIACEKLGRKCYGMEIDPGYCDVIIKRWEEFTGRKAKRGK